ncbi:n-acetylglutamate synthase [Aquimarina sp. 2201CG14-23]|uniref:n-acetylglutamate synthase n=1 Tax=Aquimarina mycalae TaxID=3040073 RepID=UPI002478201D|nr:n-acetylglutamate synthase [Aquimarina sp. 2201CG14-23]MDH7446430.1 n-acetylglutamate synthase [Aquimarina sp. 2201CG14-23]
MKINLNDKKFKPKETVDNGDVSMDTVFHYRQDGNAIWASYKGGKIVTGTLIGKIKNDRISLIYQQLNEINEFLTGCCETVISIKGGKVYLDETWQWTCKDYSKGHSLLEEI